MDARMLDANGTPRETFAMGESVVVEFDLESPSRSFPFVYMAVVIKRAETGLAVLELLNHDSGSAFGNLPVGKHRLSVEIPNCLLYPGRYRVSLRVVVVPRGVVDHVDDVLSFSMVHSGVSKRTTPFAPSWGVFYSPSVWRKT
jgi:Wzt C-terminal domain